MTQRFRYGLFFLIPVIVILDQWSKWLILNEPKFNALGCLGDRFECDKIELSSVFDLTMVWNRGISFGFGQSDGIMRWVLVLLTTGIAIGFGIWLFNALRKMTGTALALVVGGAIGNVIDRVRFGAVVDFFDFSGPWFGWKIPLGGVFKYLEYPFAHPTSRDGMLGIGFPYVFNVADAAISVGAVLLFIDQFLMSQKDNTAGAVTADEARTPE
ncbi:MAG: signal peptidase II [Pseudomonadota bacterium]